MKVLRQHITKAAISILFLTIPLWVGGVELALGQSQPTLRQRQVLPKPARTVLNPAKIRTDEIVVKFREGTRVRERLGQLEANLSDLSDAEERLLQRANLPRQRLFLDLAQINAALGPNSNRLVRRLFTRPEEELAAEKLSGETRTGEELADLNLYFTILIADARVDETERFLDQLNAMDSVEIAYAQPISEIAAADVAPTTANFSGGQGYLNAVTSNGIDAVYARGFPGGRGNDVQIIDIEKGWNLTHEDLPGVFFQAGSNLTDQKWRRHGTSVLGVLASADNAYGMTGIVPQSRIGVSSASSSFGDAVSRAAAVLRAGDIMIIELHSAGPGSGITSACNHDQFEFIAMEFWDANFDAIKSATAKGIIVVEAAGNGQMDLDSSIYGGKFDRSVRDSGAIVVGAGSSTGRTPLCFTNFGSRVDVQGWGENVSTLGNAVPTRTGDIMVNGADDNQWYRTTFGGTSSASPIVAGAAASIQGYRKAKGLGVYTSVKMRNFLRQTGVPQASSAKQIGPLPNLRAAIDAHAPKRTLKVTFLNMKVVDELFPGPHAMTFNFTVNNKSTQLSGSFPQAVAVGLPTNLSFTTQEILDEGLLVFVSTNLRSVIKFHPKTGVIISVQSRPVQLIHFFPTGTSFSTNPLVFGGSKTFTERSTTASGYFEVTYRVEHVLVWAPAFSQ